MPDWDERYRSGEYASPEPSELLRRSIVGLVPGVALDLACGAGRHALLLAENGWNVTAVDNSSVGIDILRARARERNLTIDARVADLERGEFTLQPAVYDLICDLYYLQRDLFPSIRLALRPGGTLVAAIHVFDESSKDDPRNHSYMLEAGELKAYFSDWEIVHYHETSDIDPDHGKHRHRTAELIARRPMVEVEEQ